MLWANIMKLTKPEERPKDPDRTWLQVDPDIIYPAILDHFERCQTEGTPPHPESLGYYYLQAAMLPAEAFDLARKPFGSLHDPKDQMVHDQTLELARCYMRAAIACHVKAPRGTHILKRPRWKLYV